jgi:hypothetical protein
MHYFGGTDVAKMVLSEKHPLHSIRHKMMFESVSEHFANV